MSDTRLIKVFDQDGNVVAEEEAFFSEREQEQFALLKRTANAAQQIEAKAEALRSTRQTTDSIAEALASTLDLVADILRLQGHQ